MVSISFVKKPEAQPKQIQVQVAPAAERKQVEAARRRKTRRKLSSEVRWGGSEGSAGSPTFLREPGCYASAAKGQDEDGDEWEIDEPEGVVVEMRGEDGADGGAEEEGDHDEGESAEFS